MCETLRLIAVVMLMMTQRKGNTYTRTYNILTRARNTKLNTILVCIVYSDVLSGNAKTSLSSVFASELT